VAAVDTDAEIYPELARANLARMRGDYKQAEDQLLHVLKRFPNNPTANEMLGDLAAEREDLPHAIQWYEMALEIVPNSASISRKLEEARAKVGTKEAKDTTAQLGLPDPSSRVPIAVGILVIVFLAAITGAYFLGAKGSLGQRQLPTPINQINAVSPQTISQPGEKPKDTSVAGPASVVEDQQLLDQVKAKAADAAAIESVSADPRSNSVIVTVVLPGKDDKALAARVARDTLEAFNDYNSVTIRGIAGDKVTYMADATRAKLTETESDQWKADHQVDPNAWISDLLQNEWPAAPAPGEAGSTPSETPPNSGNTSTPPTGTSGGAPGG